MSRKRVICWNTMFGILFSEKQQHMHELYWQTLIRLECVTLIVYPFCVHRKAQTSARTQIYIHLFYNACINKAYLTIATRMCNTLHIVYTHVLFCILPDPTLNFIHIDNMTHKSNLFNESCCDSQWSTDFFIIHSYE